MWHVTKAMPPAENPASVEQVASDWIAFATYAASNAPDDVFARGWVMYDLVEDGPASCWHAIKAVIGRYSAMQLYAEGCSDLQRVCGNLAAGPLEDLLFHHGPKFIEEVEVEARRDIRMRWLLGGVWPGSMDDAVSARVRRAADYSYWTRRSPT